MPEILSIQDIIAEEREELEAYRKGTAPAPTLFRDHGYIKADTGSPDVMTFVASEESEDRMGDVIEVNGWDLTNFKLNSPFLYAHNSSMPPIGKWQKTWVEGKQLLAVPLWDEEDDFARMIKGKYQRQFMRAVSVGFRAIEFKERKLNSPMQTPFGVRDTGLLFTKAELVEISAVPVPAHPKALKKSLGPRARFWIPYVPQAEPTEELKAAILTLRDAFDAFVKSPEQTPATPPPPAPKQSEALDIDGYLKKLNGIKEKTL